MFLISLSVLAQTRQSRSAGEKPIALVSPTDSLQYTLGAFMGQWINNNGFTITSPELFKRGLDDVLLNKNLQVEAAGIPARLDTYQKKLLTARSTQQETLLFANIQGKGGIGMLPSGVGYFIMKKGSGFRPQVIDSVLLHVKGFLPDGKLFEDTYAKKVPLRGVPGTFIPGLSEILQIMPVGSTWRIFIPSALAYAENGVAGVIPPYSAVIFEVELMNAARSR